MDSLFFIVLLLGFSLFYLVMGIIAARKTKNSQDFFLAGRSLTLTQVTFTLIATQLGGGMLLGTAQEAYNIGIFGILYTLGMAIGFLLLGLGLAARLQSLNIATTAELFERKYGSPLLKKIASSLSIITLFGLLIAQMVASRSIIISLGLSHEAIFIAFWAMVIGHTMVGGLQSVAATDFYQVLYIIASFGGIFIYALIQNPASLMELLPTASQTSQFLIEDLGLDKAISILLMPALFSLFEQDLAQRFFSAKNKSVAGLSALLAGIFMLAFALVPIYFGIMAKSAGIYLAPGASPLIPVIRFISSDLVVAFALCGIIAAISSTADSLMCAISSNVAQDFNIRLPGIIDPLRSFQFITALVGILALLSSYMVSSNIISILIASYEISVCCLLIPLIMSYFKNDLNKNAAWGAIGGGLMGFVLFKIYPVMMPREIAALALSALGYFLGTFKRN